jgi:hypothetical protein
MGVRSIVGRSFKILLIVAASLIAGAQTQSTQRASHPLRSSEQYWLAIDELADRVVRFAYAERFVQVHEGVLNDRECQQ